MAGSVSFPAYPSYQESGDEWLGNVPSHWEVTRLKQACEVFPSNVDKKTVDGQEAVRLCNYTDVYYNDEIHDGLSFMEASATEDQIERFQLRAGDTIFTKDSETPDDIARSAYVPDDLPGVICGYHLSMARPKAQTCGAFIKRYFDASTTRAYFHVKANGLTRVGLGQYAVDNAPIALPPPPEQTAIAAFLNRETAKIDALVAEQRRLIELLKEKRQAVISHAVIKGLDPKAPMKDSGVEWLGEMPAHWQCSRMRFIAALNPSKSETAELPSDHEVSFLPMEAIGETGELDLSRTRAVGDVRNGYSYFADGDVVFAKVTPCFENGKGAIINGLLGGIGFGTTELTVIRPRQVEDGSFLWWLICSSVFRGPGRGEMTGAGGLKRVPDDYVANFAVPWPPAPERNAIVTYLEEATAMIEMLSDEAQHSIAILQERRAALISAAVTGKIDVRGAVAQQAEAA